MGQEIRFKLPDTLGPVFKNGEEPDTLKKIRDQLELLHTQANGNGDALEDLQQS